MGMFELVEQVLEDAASLVKRVLPPAWPCARHARPPDLTDLLPRITAPTLLVAGGDDPMWTAASAGAAAAQLPRGQAATIASTRHIPALEAPTRSLA